MKVFVSQSKSREVEIKFKVRDSDALDSVLGLLAQMNRDTTQGHGSLYIADGDGDERTEHYIDGDGAAYVGDIRIKEDGSNWQNVNNIDYLKRGKYEFCKGVDLEGKSVHSVKENAKVRYEGEDLYVSYTQRSIILSRELDGKDQQVVIPWKEYLKLPFKKRDKFFTVIEG